LRFANPIPVPSELGLRLSELLMLILLRSASVTMLICKGLPEEMMLCFTAFSTNN